MVKVVLLMFSVAECCNDLRCLKTICQIKKSGNLSPLKSLIPPFFEPIAWAVLLIYLDNSVCPLRFS